MNYLEVDFSVAPATAINKEIVTALISGLKFESFVEEESGVKAYILKSDYDESELTGIFDGMEFSVNYSVKEIEQENWNATWEENYFQPIQIGNECVVRAPFHTDYDKAKYEIVIYPKMSFGTGHHETTSLMLQKILDVDITGKTILDMGCGTAILAILCKMKGAGKTLGIDIDQWCYDNSIENAQLNDVEMDVEIGDAALLEGRKFEIILANINRNVLLNDIKVYAKSMEDGATLLMSGFYSRDLDLIKAEAEKNGLRFIESHFKNDWTVAEFKKQ